jgi:hypothetical protein
MTTTFRFADIPNHGSTEWWAEVRRRSDEDCAAEAVELAAVRARLDAAEAVVHRSADGDRSHHRLACESAWVESKWGNALTEFKEVYRLEDDRLFTFRDELVTCAACVARRPA